MNNCVWTSHARLSRGTEPTEAPSCRDTPRPSCAFSTALCKAARHSASAATEHALVTIATAIMCFTRCWSVPAVRAGAPRGTIDEMSPTTRTAHMNDARRPARAPATTRMCASSSLSAMSGHATRRSVNDALSISNTSGAQSRRTATGMLAKSRARYTPDKGTCRQTCATHTHTHTQQKKISSALWYQRKTLAVWKGK